VKAEDFEKFVTEEVYAPPSVPIYSETTLARKLV
jgi:hypothetical protein